MLEPIIIIGIIGSLSSVASLAINTPNKKSKIIHAIYVFVIAIIAGSSVLYSEHMKNTVEEVQKQLEASNDELEQLKSVQAQALAIIGDASFTYNTDVGENRGFILASFTFFETHKSTFPETYLIAKELVINGLNVTASAGDAGSPDYYDERKRMQDGSAAMRQMLRGIAGEKVR